MTTVHEQAMAEQFADLIAVPYTAIPPEEVIPLWPGWIPRRHVTIVAAPGGTSKGLWVDEVAARVTTGKPWPGEPTTAVREPEAVIIIAYEDDPNEAVAWRLKAADADMSLVFNLTILPDGSEFSLASLSVLTDAKDQIKKLTGRDVGLVIIDPLFGMIKVKLPGRKEIAPVEAWARANGPAVIVCHHTVASGKVAGLKELTNAVRNVLRISRIPGADKSNPAREVTVEKTNMGSDAASIRYVIVGTEGENDWHVIYPLDLTETPAVSRGYTINPAALAGGTPAISSAGASTWQILVMTQGDDQPVKLGDDYASAALGKADCEKHAGHKLPWKRAEDGSYYAATLVAGGKTAAYTVYPNAGKGVKS